MKYSLSNGKIITIPDKEIEKAMQVLELTHDEAIQMWLEDNDYEVNEEQAELDNKAKQVKIQHGASAVDKERKTPKERVVKVSDEKKELFDTILQGLGEFSTIPKENITILKDNKLISIRIGEKTFKIDLIEQRPPKNK